MINEVKSKILNSVDDEYFYLACSININSGIFVHNKKPYYVSKNFQKLQSEKIVTDLLSLQINRYISNIDKNCSLKPDYYNLIEFKDDINSENFDSFINLCFMHANIAEQKPLNMFFNSLINLFQIPREQQFKNIVGLYGELSFILYIYQTYGIDLTSFWHCSGSNDSYDFKLKNVYFEIKSTLKNEPIIKLKHQQIFNNFTDKIFLGIVQLQENITGKSLLELVEEIEKMQPINLLYDFKLNLEKEKRKISSSDYKNKKMNVNSINIYQAIDLPSIEKIPNNISDIEYNYNFNSINKYTIKKDFLKENV